MPRGARGAIVLPTKGRQASWTAPALADRPRSRARWQSTAIASSIQTRWTTALFRPHGVVAHGRPASPAKPECHAAAKVSAVSEKTHGQLLSSHRTARSHAGRPRLWLDRSRRPCIPRASGCKHCALRRCNQPVALCPPQAGLGAPRPAPSPPDSPTASHADQTGRSAQTPGVDPVSHLESPHQRCLAQRSRGCPIGHVAWLL
jgi:hypothetical protein